MQNTENNFVQEEFIFPQLILEETLYTLAQLKNAAPENAHIALAGRSNVGKSSLINALAKRKQLAKVSATPGKTRSVNLYRVDPHDFFLTDLPGYGYAKRSKSERELWANLIEKYLIECENLIAVAILLDCRLEPQEADKIMVQFALAHNIPIIPILTKADKCTQKERSERISQWTVLIPRGEPIAVSAHSGFGLRELWKKLIAVAEKAHFNHKQIKEDLLENTQEEKSEIIQVEENITVSQDNTFLDQETQNEKPKKIRTKRGAVAREKEMQKKLAQDKARKKAQEEKSRAKHKKK